MSTDNRDTRPPADRHAEIEAALDARVLAALAAAWKMAIDRQLIAGVYLPAMQALRQCMGLNLAVLPGLMALGFGVIAGAAISVHAIRSALQRHRSEMVWLILGLMLGSLYAIVMGPTTLVRPMPALSAATFHFGGFATGAAVLLGLELLRKKIADSETPRADGREETEK